MKQNYKNHARFNPLFHFVLIPLSVGGLVVAVRECVQTPTVANFLIATVFLMLLIASAALRTSLLKVQDRAIRAEEGLRYFTKTGKSAPTTLRLSQIIALRFASDDEFLELTERAANEKLSSKEIKQAIKNWREDRHRA